MVERAHRQLKETLHAREAGADWPEHLPWMLLGLCAASKEANGLVCHQLSWYLDSFCLYLADLLTGMSQLLTIFTRSLRQSTLLPRASPDPTRR